MEKKVAVLVFPDEEIEEIKEKFSYLEKTGKLCVEYIILSVFYLDDIEETLKTEEYSHVFISSLRHFYELEEFFWFGEMTLCYGAEFYIAEPELNSRTRYYLRDVLFDLKEYF